MQLPTSNVSIRGPAFSQPVVAHVRVVTSAGGGPDKTILNSPRYLNRYGYRAICAYMHPPGDPGFHKLEQMARKLDAPLFSIPDHGAWDLRVIRLLWKLCRRNRVAIWHAHDYKSNVLGLLLRPFWPMKLVTTVHGWVSTAGRSRQYYKIDRRSLRYYERVICVSSDLYDECLASGVSANRCTVIQNAVDTEQFSPGNSRIEAKLRQGFHPHRFCVGAVGRLATEKAFDRLILAVDRLLDRGFDLELVIVGEGEERPRLESLIAKLNRGDRIRLLGYRTDTVLLFQAMDLFVLSSLREGLPNVVLEALAVQVPVVATRIAGVPSLIRDGHNGLLVEPDNVDQLAAAVERLIGDAALRARMALAGRRTVEESYSFEVRMQKIRAVYDRLLPGDKSSQSEQLTSVACPELAQ
jgi:glycosyltransferase involved in cell wall biosynthesis